MDDTGGSNRRVWQRVRIGTYEPDQTDGADADADANQHNSHATNYGSNRPLPYGSTRPNCPFFDEPIGPQVNRPRRGFGEVSFCPRMVPGGRNSGTARQYNSRNFSRFRGPGNRVYQGSSNAKRGSKSRKNKGRQSKKRGRGGYYVGSSAKGTSKNRPKGRRMKRRTRQTAFTILKAAYINEDAFYGRTIDECYYILTSNDTLNPRPGVKTPAALPPNTTFAKLYIDLKNEVAEVFNKRQLYSCKKTARAAVDASLGQVMAGVVKIEDAKQLPKGGWRKVLRNAVLHYTKAICKLEQTGEGPPGKWALNEKAICDLYYSRAQAYCMLQRYGDFWSDALVALSLSPYTKQMELVTKLVEKRIEQVRRNADPRQKNRTTSEAAVKKWREDSRAALKRAEDFLLLQAIIDQQNDNKINRLMAFYRQIAQLRKERLVEGDKPKPPKANPTQAPEKKPKALATNIFDYVEVLEDNRLRVKKNIAKNRTVFYEQVIAFESGSGKNGGSLVSSHCANCYRRLLISKAVPCSVCSDALFCNALCREVAQGHSFACQLTAQVRAKLSRNSYFAFQLICYCNFFILFSVEKGKLYRSAFKDPFSITSQNDSSTIDYWPRYAVIAAVQKRIECREINVVTQADQHLLADALYLTKVLVNIATVRFVPDQQISSADEKFVFTMMYKLLWIVHHDPLASSRLGKRKDFALTPFGNMLNFSCKPNVKRKFNPKKGRIEYQALVDLKPNDILSVSWGSLLYAKEKSQQNKVKRAEGRKKPSSVSPTAVVGTTQEAAQVTPVTRVEMVKQLFALNHSPCPNCPEFKTPPAST